MGSIWSSERGTKIHSSSHLNEERGELAQEDSDSNCEEIFYETVDNVSSSNGDLALQKLSAETQNSYTKEPHETTSTTGDEAKGEKSFTYHQQEEKISDSAVYEKCSDLSNNNTEASRDSLIATEECEEKDTKTKKWTSVPCRDLPLLEEEDKVLECSNFSLPLISEEKVFREKHFKSISDPQMFASVDYSQEPKPDIPRSCSWQVDVDCFKSKKRKKPPKKYLKAKDQQHGDVNKKFATRDKELFTESYLVSSEMATQEMMARRKVLDLRRW